MIALDRKRVLYTLLKHETLTIGDIAKKENLGIVPNEIHLHFLLDELHASGHIKKLNDIEPSTYTITDKGISECERLKVE